VVITILYGLHLRNTAYKYTIVDQPIRADAYDYYFYAKNLAEFGVFSRKSKGVTRENPPVADALRSPGFPALASLFMNPSPGATISTTIAAQTILQVVCFLLLTFMFIKWLGLGWSIPAIILLWTFPHFVSINTYYLTESLFTSGLALFIFLYWYFSGERFVSAKGAIMCGLLLGLLALVRPVVQYMPWFISVAVLFQYRQAYRRVAIFLGMALLPIIAWKIRNLVAIGATSDPTLMINALYHGSFSGFMYNGIRESLGFPYRFDPHANEVKAGVGATLTLIGERFLAAPFKYLEWYLFGKQMFLWRWDILAGAGDIYIYPIFRSPYLTLPDMQWSHALNKIIHPYWIIGGFVSVVAILIRFFKSRASVQPIVYLLVLIIMYVTLIHEIVAPFPRYSIPFKVALIAVAALGLKELTQWIMRLKRKA
jgi:hypothetical protein